MDRWNAKDCPSPEQATPGVPLDVPLPEDVLLAAPPAPSEALLCADGLLPHPATAMAKLSTATNTLLGRK